MKASKDYYEEALKDLGASESYGVPIQAATELALIKAMKDFLIELEYMEFKNLPFSFDIDGNLYVKDSDKA